jgi:topoisomerase-4 subunit A
MNMNVLVDGVVPRVVSLDEALRQWLDHRRTVLQRRSRHRSARSTTASKCWRAC